MDDKIIAINSQADIINARKIGREMAKIYGFGPADQTRLATAISEITRNALQYGGGGTCVISGSVDNVQKKISVMIEDKGPGIKDIDLAMQDGFTTGKGLGAGLPGSKRLMHEFNIDSNSGGTKVTMSIFRKIF